MKTGLEISSLQGEINYLNGVKLTLTDPDEINRINTQIRNLEYNIEYFRMKALRGQLKWK